MRADPLLGTERGCSPSPPSSFLVAGSPVEGARVQPQPCVDGLPPPRRGNVRLLLLLLSQPPAQAAEVRSIPLNKCGSIPPSARPESTLSSSSSNGNVITLSPQRIGRRHLAVQPLHVRARDGDGVVGGGAASHRLLGHARDAEEEGVEGRGGGGGGVVGGEVVGEGRDAQLADEGGEAEAERATVVGEEGVAHHREAGPACFSSSR